MSWIRNSFLIFILYCFPIKSKEQRALISNFENSISILVNIAENSHEKEKGLMDVQKLINTNGMLFLYDYPQKVNFWMKNTFIDLDIIFINENKHVLFIKSGTKHSKSIISSEFPVIAVLEIPLNCSKKIGLKKGVKLKWKKIKRKSFRKYIKKGSDLFPCLK